MRWKDLEFCVDERYTWDVHLSRASIFELIDGDRHSGSIDNERTLLSCSQRRAAGGRFHLGKNLGGG